MVVILFRCPTTNLNVQHRLEGDDALHGDENVYEPVQCPACTKSHLMNRKTRKILGHERDGSPA